MPVFIIVIDEFDSGISTFVDQLKDKGPGPNFIKPVSKKKFAQHEISSLIKKQDYQQNFHVIFRISKQQLNTGIKQYATNGNLVGNPVFIKEEVSC